MLRMSAANKLWHEQNPVVAQLLVEADLRRVVAVDGHDLDRPEEVRADPLLTVGVAGGRDAA